MLLLSIATLNLQSLLPLFIMACVCIYTFCANVFNMKVIVKNKTAKAKLKDWIKVNAFVTSIFAVYNLSVCIHYATNPTAFALAIKAVQEQQQAMLTQSGMSVALLEKLFKAVIYGLGLYGIVLVIHIVYTVFLMNLFKDKFE